MSPAGRSGADGRALAWGAAAIAPVVAGLAVTAGIGLPVRSPATDLAVLVLWSVSEEVVFRGALQPWLAARPGLAGRRGGVSAANAVTSAAFVVAHLWHHAAIVALTILPVSLVLGAVREQTRRLWPAVALHVWFNVALYAASWLAASLAASPRTVSG